MILKTVTHQLSQFPVLLNIMENCKRLNYILLRQMEKSGRGILIL